MAELLDLLNIALPIIQAPMAGGPDTPALAAAVSNAGGLGSIGCAYLSAATIEELATDVRARTDKPFALNLFVRPDDSDDVGAQQRAALTRVRVMPHLRSLRAELGLTGDPGPGRDLDAYSVQLEAVLRAKPAVFSFTFGIPSNEAIGALRERGIVSIGTATTVEEAEALDDLGVDAICAQGSEAGGHRGTFLGRFEDALIGTMALVPQIVKRVGVPVIAAGGIVDGAGIRAALSLGAAAVQIGTAFMVCPEAGTPPAHRKALMSTQGQRTVVTRAFSGRPARGLRNRMTDLFETVQPAEFPAQQQLTAELRTAATSAGRTDLMQMWAGQAAPLVREMPADELVETLAREARLTPRPISRP